jgi:hypothetical protein
MRRAEEQFNMTTGDSRGGKTSKVAGRKVGNAFPDRLRDIELGPGDPREPGIAVHA